MALSPEFLQMADLTGGASDFSPQGASGLGRFREGMGRFSQGGLGAVIGGDTGKTLTGVGDLLGGISGAVTGQPMSRQQLEMMSKEQLIDMILGGQ